MLPVQRGSTSAITATAGLYNGGHLPEACRQVEAEMGAQDLYKVLGVSSDATQEQLEKAYKQRQSAKVGS